MTLIKALRRQVEEQPDKVLFTFLAEGEEPAGTLTFAELYRDASRVAAALAARTDVGDRVLLLYEPGLGYITAFFACVLSGRIAVPVYPPNPRRLETTLPRLMHIVMDSAPTAVATTSMIHGLAGGLFSSMGMDHIKWLATDDLDDQEAPYDEVTDSGEVAFLQYTSGSTAKPRGVRVTHQNLLSNVELIAQALRADRDTVGVSWLPLYHDMGLIGKVITPATIGCSAVLMSPLDYLRRPFRWLQAISRFGGTVSAAPNFAYDLCVRKVTEEEFAQLDLSGWKVALNGAEPVLADTLAAFTKRFGPAGFDPKAFLPAYGLAESTLLVTGATAGVKEFEVDAVSLEKGQIEIGKGQISKSLIGSGAVPGTGHQVHVVQPEQCTVVGEGEVGEIWVSGPSIADGYWNQPELSSKTFGAKLAVDDGREYLRTGDLGFFLGNELVVTGRSKDLMILRGRNIYPQDVEATVTDAHVAIRPGGMAAFSVDGPDGEVAVIVAELERRTRAGRAGDDRRHLETLPDHEVAVRPEVDDVTAAIRTAVLDVHQVDVDTIVLIKPGSVPKTSSGKIQRRECRRQFLEGELDEFGRSARPSVDEVVEEDIPTAAPKISVQDLSFVPRSERAIRLEEYLIQLVAFVVQIGPSIVKDRPLMSVGLDSLRAMELQYAIEETLGVRLFPSLLLGGATVADVAEELAKADYQAALGVSGLSDISSEVFSEPSEGQLTEMIRFDVDGVIHHGIGNPNTQLAFAEDDNPWGPTATVEFSIADDRDVQLSWNEKGFWLYQQAFPTSWAPNLYYAGELPERTSVVDVFSAADRIVARHDNLRVRYAAIAGFPTRIEDDHVDANVDVVSARGWSKDELLAEFERRASRPFDLEEGPVIRFAYFETDGAPILYMMMHHIAADFWSLEKLIGEFAAELAGVEIPDPKVTYSDFVSWQGKLLNSERGAWCENYWREQLAEGVNKLVVPRSRHATSRQGHGRPYRAALDLGLVKSIDALASQRSTTRYTLLLAAYQLLLFRWTGQREFHVGAVAAGRTRRFFRDVMGMFANPLPMRARFDDTSITFSEHLAQTQARLLSAMDAQEYPLQAMLERFDLPRTGVDNPIIQTLFASEQPRDGSLEIGADVSGLRTVDLGLAGTVFDFTVMVYQGADGGEIRLQYNDAKYDEATAARMADGYRELLREIVANPELVIGTAPLLDAKSVEKLGSTWSHGVSRAVQPSRIHERFEQMAERYPAQPAVVSDRLTWSYADLNARANRLASALIEAGVTPGTMVGVEVERSPALIAALFGVLKAGGTYVALQPSLPFNRLAYMAEDAGVRVTLTDDVARHDLGGTRIDVSAMEDGARSTSNPAVDVSDDDLAYLLYTSGTTGQPKGVMLPHRAVRNLVDVIQAKYPVGPTDAILQKTPYSFDISVSEIFNPLCAGARLVMTKSGASRDPAYLRDLIIEHQISVLRMTPTELASLFEAEGIERCDDIVTRVLACGEALTPAVCGRFHESWPNVELINLWGPTEACIYASWWPFDAANTLSVPIGQPLPNYNLYALDDVLELRPVELQGELFVSGPSLARGYHGLPQKTALAYLPDPFATAPGARMYKSGDLVSWNEDGELEFFGRRDSQVQLRGMRIELGELEAVLEMHDGVRQAAVCALTAADGRVEALAAYVCLEKSGGLSTADLRAHLSEHVEESKIPGQFIELDAMPLTPSGKIDRKALPSPDERMRSAQRREPETAAEKQLAALWCRYLRLEDVGADENFFEIGGHSLLAVRIQHDIMRTFGLDVPLGMLFENPTVALLAAKLDGAEELDFEPVERHEYGDEAPLSAGQRLMWIQQYLESGAVTYHSPGVFGLEGSLDVDALGRALTRLVARHEILRTIYPLQGDEPVQKILPPAPVDVVFEDLRSNPAAEYAAQERAAEFVAIPFDLTRETSFRVLVMQTGARRHVLCLLFHHIAFDEWSVDVLFEEIEALYAQEAGDLLDQDEARMEDWKQTYQVAYRNLEQQLANGEIEDPTFNTDGWLSSFHGEKYSDDEMSEWLTSTLERLDGLKLGRTLEIGCGTGMILFRLAPRATEYVGLDFSPAAIAYIDAVRHQLDEDYSNVELVQGRADEIGDIDGEFDTIVINSVAQYFPHHEYLEDVIRAAVRKLKPGGRFYLGDLRDARTAYAFHADVTQRRAVPDSDREDLRERTVQRLVNDDELVISPQYLAQIAKGLPNITHVDFNYQRAKHRTEMSVYRFGAMLHAASAEDYRAPDRVLTWSGQRPAALATELEDFRGSLLVTGIPHARLQQPARLARWMNSSDDDVTYGQFKQRELPASVEPDDLRVLGEPLGFRVTVSPSNDAEGARFDALFEYGKALSDVRPLTPLTSLATPIPLPNAVTDATETVDAHTLWKQLIDDSVLRAYGRSKDVEGAKLTLPEPALQYADFAIWQNEQFETADYRAGLEYWKRHLHGSVAELAWPIGGQQQRHRPAGYIQHTWGETTSNLVAEYARNQGTSEFVVLYTAFTAFLSATCRQQDLTIGVGTTLRQRPEFRGLLGYMLNMLPLRSRQREDANFDRWFADARTNWEASQPHQWIPTEKIVEAVGAERDAGKLPLYDVMMAYVPRNHLRRSSAITDDFVRDLAGLKVSPFDYGGVPDALCSLFVSMFKDGEQIGTEFEFDAARFDRWQMEQLAQRFEWAVEQAVRLSTRPIRETMSFADAKPEQSLGTWTRGPRFKFDDVPVHRQFEAWAAKAPERTALAFEDGSWSFGELDQRANRLANTLRDLGVGIGTRVGVTVERSPELIAALLGVLKAGGTYVAMEPDLPSGRLHHIANDCGADFIVVDESGRVALGDGQGRTYVDISVTADASISAANPDVAVEPSDVVYMLYTSGTTGQPKGVMVPHHAVANHVGWLAAGFKCDANDTFLLKSSYGFDMSVSELYGPLCLGGTMAIAKPDGQRDPKYLVDAVCRFNVTCLRVVPTTLNLLLTEPDAARMGETLRWVSLGGEALSKSVRDHFFDTFETVELHNPFGITETCVDVTHWECPRSRRGYPVSLGRPMGNYDAYALDDWLEPVPLGKTGEIFVGGPGVAYGYWGMPTRTAQIFVPNPFSDKPGARMYGSGDLAQWNVHQELQYQGRKDDQIQLNGVRIELGEIEAHLEAAPSVLQGAVRTVNEVEGHAEALIAYIVPREGEAVDIPAIRAHLEANIRRAVIPSQFVVLDKMPRRPSGKIDRDALPDPNVSGSGEAARSGTEERLLEIWCGVLGVDSIGRDDNFFEVGGTSLKAIKIYRQIDAEFDKKFEVVELFAYPTVAQLAAFIDGEENEDRVEEKEEQRRRGKRRRESAQQGRARRGRRDK